MLKKSSNNENHYKSLIFNHFNLLLFKQNKAQCNQDYNWTNWQSFSGESASGIINNNGKSIKVTMTANYTFSSTPSIYTYQAFSGFNSVIPNSTVPKTTWAVGAGGLTTMCFDQTVMNPVLLISSLGNPGVSVTLHFSIPYLRLYDGGGMIYSNDTTIIGNEGYAILLFPGSFNCVRIYSTTPEYYTNITWGLNPPPFPVSISGNSIGCDSVTLTATGGASYIWNGGTTPDSSSNTFDSSRTYFLTVTDKNGCTVTTSRTVMVKHKSFSSISKTIYKGQNYLGYTSTGTYIDTLTAANGCDSIRTLNLSVIKPKTFSTINYSICEGQSYLGYTSTGTYIDTLVSFNGCDSIRKLNLKVNSPSNVTLHISICTGNQFLGHTATGTYSDTLLSSNGCDSIVTTFLTVEKNCEVYFPTAFTPNNDGQNDFFRILNAHEIENYSLRIYNRWGQLIFETKDYTLGWDGTYRGNLQPIGVYVWFCRFYQSGKYKEMNGTITLIR